MTMMKLASQKSSKPSEKKVDISKDMSKMITIMKEIKLQKLKCKKCGHEWLPRVEVVYQCPKCKTAKWNVERKD